MASSTVANPVAVEAQAVEGPQPVSPRDAEARSRTLPAMHSAMTVPQLTASESAGRTTTRRGGAACAGRSRRRCVIHLSGVCDASVTCVGSASHEFRYV